LAYLDVIEAGPSEEAQGQEWMRIEAVAVIERYCVPARCSSSAMPGIVLSGLPLGFWEEPKSLVL
jgi:hypothetical protein